ncbi:hypothetical protein ACFX13_012860 [Malus domestica]
MLMKLSSKVFRASKASVTMAEAGRDLRAAWLDRGPIPRTSRSLLPCNYKLSENGWEAEEGWAKKGRTF